MARKKRRIRRGVRVRRVVRRVELGSLFRFALAFHFLCYAVSVAALAIVMKVIEQLGLLGRVEKFLQDAGFAKGFKINLGLLLRAAGGIGLGFFIIAVVATMLLGFFFNGLSGLLGGLVFSVLEEKPAPAKSDPQPAAAVAPAAGNASDPGSTGWDEGSSIWDGPEQSGSTASTVV